MIKVIAENYYGFNLCDRPSKNLIFLDYLLHWNIFIHMPEGDRYTGVHKTSQDSWIKTTVSSKNNHTADEHSTVNAISNTVNPRIMWV